MMKLAVDELRGDFKQMAIEGGRQGAQMVINGEDMAELQQDLEKKERTLLELKMKKKELENNLSSQKEKNEELELLVVQKERQIKILENEVDKIKKILNTHKTELEQEEALRKMKEEKEEALRKMKEEKEEALRKRKEKKDEALRKMKEDKLLSEIKDLEDTCDKLKSTLQRKKSAGSLSKIKIKKLEEHIAELEGKLKERKDKKS